MGKEYTDLSKKRLSIAKEYLDKLKEKMGDHLISAYIYGSTAKNIPRENSDIDIILVVKKPSREEKFFMNSEKGGLFNKERQGCLNFAFNSHYLWVFLRELQKKYSIEISPYYHYEDEGLDFKIREAPFCLKNILAEPTLKYPNDFKNISYL